VGFYQENLRSDRDIKEKIDFCIEVRNSEFSLPRYNTRESEGESQRRSEQISTANRVMDAGDFEISKRVTDLRTLSLVWCLQFACKMMLYATPLNSL